MDDEVSEGSVDKHLIEEAPVVLEDWEKFLAEAAVDRCVFFKCHFV